MALRHFILAIVFYSSLILSASETTRSSYLDLIKEYPTLLENRGNAEKGEIEIVTDPKEMAKIEVQLKRDVGLIARDKYWLWINDACIFPSGAKGVYGRILWAGSLEGEHGAAVLPVTAEGEILVLLTYRHATRSFEIELPRGGLKRGESPADGAKREVFEETGARIEDLQLLGTMPPDSGLTNSSVPVYTGRVTQVEGPQREETEAIERVLSLSITEIKTAFLRGFLECVIQGKKTQVPFRDPFLAYAILLYEAKESTCRIH